MAISKSILQKKLASLKDKCQEKGLKLTHQRMEIFRELASATDHPSAETLYARLNTKLPTLSLDTIYRTLATFEEHGLAARVDTVESQARYEAELDQHHHAICSECGQITDFNWGALDKMQMPAEIAGWGRIDNQQVTLHGVCGKCELKKTK